MLLSETPDRFSTVVTHKDLNMIFCYLFIIEQQKLNPYKPSILFVGHRKTVQTQINKPSLLFCGT